MTEHPRFRLGDVAVVVAGDPAPQVREAFRSCWSFVRSYAGCGTAPSSFKTL